VSKLLLSVCFPSDTDCVTDVVGFTARHAARMFVGDLGQRARIATHEIVENAGKFSSATGEILLELFADGAGFDLRVSNDALGSRIAILRRQVELAQTIDTTEQYARLMRKHLDTRNEPSTLTPGIGLFRVRHDALVEIVLTTDGARVTITARGQPVAPVAAARANRQSSSRNKITQT
jgi:hypothetical protein